MHFIESCHSNIIKMQIKHILMNMKHININERANESTVSEQRFCNISLYFDFDFH